MIKNALSIISNAQILTSDDINVLSHAQKELAQTFSTVQMFRTETEMRVSVLKDINFPTPDSKYWQCVREQNVMFNALVYLSYEYRKNAVEIQILKRDITAEEDELQRELLSIEQEKKEFAALQMVRTAKARIDEILKWSSIKAELKPLLKYDDKDVNLHQLEAMKKRFAAEASLVNNHTAISDKINIIGKAETVKRM